MKADFAIITIKWNEVEAILNRFDATPIDGQSGRSYGLCQLQTKTGKACCTVIIARCSEQGNDSSQQVAHDIINDFDPQILLVVGIAGGVPGRDFTLGDVIVSSRIHNFDVGARKPGGLEQKDVRGGIHPRISNIIASLPFRMKQLSGWNTLQSVGLARPQLDPQKAILLGEDEEWREEVRDSLNTHFGDPQNRDRPPLFQTGTIASSNDLNQDSVVLIPWLKTARSILAVEMESAGVLQAASRIRDQYPVMAIRGISDIVGLKREVQWETFACHTAAAFAHAFVTAGIIEPRPSTPTTVHASPASPAPHTSSQQSSSLPAYSSAPQPIDTSQAAQGRSLDDPFDVFISYAQEDEKFKKQLETHLKMLQRNNVIRPWHSQQISPGQERDQATASRIDSAQIILLLISTSFLNSDDLYENELSRAMKRHESGNARVIPIIVRSVDLEKTSFSKLQSLPRDGKPVDRAANADETWAKIAKEIRELCDSLRTTQEKYKAAN